MPPRSLPNGSNHRAIRYKSPDKGDKDRRTPSLGSQPNPRKAWCIAVLTPTAFAKRKPNAEKQTWWLAVAQDKVVWRRNEQSFVFAQGA